MTRLRCFSAFLLAPLLVAPLATPLFAQTNYLAFVGVGRAFRLGNTPAHYANAGSNITVYAYQGFRLKGPFFAAVHLGQASQTMDDSDLSLSARTFRFQTRTLGVGPEVALHAFPRTTILAALTQSWILSYWSKIGECFGSCYAAGPSPPKPQTAYSYGTELTLGMTYLITSGGWQDIPFGVGISTHLMAAPKHVLSQIPQSQAGIYAFFFGGNP